MLWKAQVLTNTAALYHGEVAGKPLTIQIGHVPVGTFDRELGKLGDVQRL